MADEFINIEVVNERAKQKLEELQKLFSKMGYSMDEAGERLDKVFGDGAAAKFEKIYQGLYVNEKALRAINETAAKGQASFQQRISQLETELLLTDETDKKKKASLEKEKDFLEANLEMHKKVADATREQVKAQKELEAELQNTISKQTYQANPQAGGVLNSFHELKAQAEEAGVMFDNLDARTTRALNHINDGLEVSARDLKKIIEDNEETIKRLAEESDKLGRVMDASEMDEGIKEKAKQRVGIIEDEITARKELNKVVETAQKQKATGDDVENVRIRTRIMNLKQEIIEYRLAGKEESEYYQNMVKEVQTLQKEQHKLNAELELLSSAHPMTKTILTGLQGISSGFAVAQGAMALFGSENKDLQKVMTKLQALMSITIGLQSVQQALDKKSAIITILWNKVLKIKNALLGTDITLTQGATASTTALTGATTGATVATTGLAKAFVALRVAIKSVPVIGWILALLSAVIAAIAAYRKSQASELQKIKEQREALVESGKKLSEAAAEPVNKLESLSAQWKKLSTISQQNDFIKKNADAFKELGLSIKSVSDAQDVLIKNKDRYINYLIDTAVLEAQLKENEGKAARILAIRTQYKKQKKNFEQMFPDMEINDNGGLVTATHRKNNKYDVSGDSDDAIIQRQRAQPLVLNMQNTKNFLEKETEEYRESVKDYVESKEKLNKEYGDLKFAKDTKKQSKEIKKEIELEKETLEARIAYYRNFYDERRKLVAEDNVTVFQVIDKAEIANVSDLYDQIYKLEEEALKNQRDAYVETAQNTIKDATELGDKILEINDWYEEELAAKQNQRDKNKSSLGGSAFDAEKKQFENMLSEADTAEQKLALVNEQIAKLQGANRNEAQNKFLADLQKQAADLTKDIAKQEADLYADLLAEYGSYAEKKKAIEDDFNKKIAAAQKENNTELVEALQLELNAAVANLAQELTQRTEEAIKKLIKGKLWKEFQGRGGKQNMKKALADMRELDSDTVSDELLAKFDITRKQWEENRDAIHAARLELEDVYDNKYSSQFVASLQKMQRLFKDMFDKDGALDMEKFTAWLNELTNQFNLFADTIGEVGNTFSKLGDLTHNSTLSEIGKTFTNLSNVVSSTAQGISAGSAFGPYGAAAGAIIGAGKGVIEMLINDEEEIAQANKEQAERTMAAFEGVVSAIDNAISSLDSFAGTLNSLNYTQLQSAANDLIIGLKGTLNDLIPNMIQSAMDVATKITPGSGFVQMDLSEIVKQYGSLQAAREQGFQFGDYLEELFRKLDQLGIDIDKYFGGDGVLDSSSVMNATAIMSNRIIGLHDELQGLIDELQAMKDDPGTSALDYFNKMQEIRRKNLEIMEYQRLMLEQAGEDTTDIENEILKQQQAINEATAEFVGAYAGIDIAGVVDEWISAFDEFGTSGTMAFDKINQSVDKMVANFLKQTLVVEKLQAAIKDIWSKADTDDNGVLSDDEIRDAIDNTRNAYKDASDMYNRYQSVLEQMGIELDEVSGNSFSAAVKGVSEETASIIAGQMNAIRVHQIEIQEILRTNISSNVEIIARNSAFLPQIYDRLGRVESAVNNTYQQRIGALS